MKIPQALRKEKEIVKDQEFGYHCSLKKKKTLKDKR